MKSAKLKIGEFFPIQKTLLNIPTIKVGYVGMSSPKVVSLVYWLVGGYSFSSYNCFVTKGQVVSCNLVKNCPQIKIEDVSENGEEITISIVE